MTSENFSNSSNIFGQIAVIIFPPGGTAHLGEMRTQHTWIS